MTLLCRGLSILPGFLGNLRRLVSQPDPRLLLLARRAPLVLARLRSSCLVLLPRVSLARGRRRVKARLPFPLPPEALATQEVRVKAPGKSQPDGVLPVRVGGCLAQRWRQWHAVGAETWVVTVLRDGYRVPFKDSPPPLSPTPVSFPTYRAGSPRAQALRQEVEAMLAKGALEIARDPGPGFYSRLFLVEKATGGWRPVIDLSHLNDFIQLTPFKMETVALVLLFVREGDFLASLDLKDAYFQIPIHGSSRKLLRFMSEGTVYQFKALSIAPQVFTRVFVAVSAWAHSRGIRLLRYLDDWLVLSSSEKKARQSVQELLSICHTLGIVINEKKSDLVPSQAAKYLGMTIDTGAGKVFPSLARVEKFLSVAERFCALESPPAQLWQVILGHLASLERLVPHGRLRMRSLQWQLKTHWSPVSDPPSLPMALPEEARRDLSWWMVRDHLLTGVRFGTPAPDLHLYSDASSSGWGAHLLDQNVSGVWSNQEKLLHINLLEMKALFLGLQAFQEDVIGHHVTAMCDNSTVVAYVNKQGGTVSRGLCLLTSCLLRWTESFDVHLEARYLPGESNVLADLLSRSGQVIGTEWSLHPQVVRSLLRVWRNPSIDLFVTCLNANCPCIARLSRIHRPSSRMRFAILGMTWIFMRSLPFLWSVG